MNEKKATFSNVDKAIIRILAKNGRMRDNELARTIGVSDDTVRRRRQKLEEKGYFKIEATFNARRFGYTNSYQLGFVLVPGADTRSIAERLAKLELVHYVALSLGPTHSILANCRSREPFALNRLVEDLRKWKAIERVDVNIIYDVVKSAFHGLPHNAFDVDTEKDVSRSGT